MFKVQGSTFDVSLALCSLLLICVYLRSSAVELETGSPGQDPPVKQTGMVAKSRFPTLGRAGILPAQKSGTATRRPSLLENLFSVVELETG